MDSAIHLRDGFIDLGYVLAIIFHKVSWQSRRGLCVLVGDLAADRTAGVNRAV